MGGGKVKSIL
jgi:hypothetical protein